MDDTTEKYAELGRTVSMDNIFKEPMTIELADMLRYALGVAHGMIERGESMYDPPAWIDELWHFAFIKLQPYRESGMLPDVDYWSEFIAYLSDKAHSENGE